MWNSWSSTVLSNLISSEIWIYGKRSSFQYVILFISDNMILFNVLFWWRAWQHDSNHLVICLQMEGFTDRFNMSANANEWAMTVLACDSPPVLLKGNLSRKHHKEPNKRQHPRIECRIEECPKCLFYSWQSCRFTHHRSKDLNFDDVTKVQT